MLEQSKQNGVVYWNNENNSHAVTLSKVSFGPPTAIDLMYIGPEKYCVRIGGQGYVFIDGELSKVIENPMPMGDIYSYNYGVCIYREQRELYLIKNSPTVSIDEIPTIEEFQLPTSFAGLAYEQEFSYSEDVRALFKDFPATYVDSRKRPLNYQLMQQGRFFPISIDAVTTKFSDMSGFPNYPIVVDLRGTDYAMVDVEPGYGDEEKALLSNFDVIYREETPRGGIHLLIRVDDTAFKRRVTEFMEIINETMITVYGIKSRIIDEGAGVTDISEFKEVGGSKNLHVNRVEKSLEPLADKIYKDIVEIDADQPLIGEGQTLGEVIANTTYSEYISKRSPSTAEFVTLCKLYENDLRPIFDDNLVSRRQSSRVDKLKELRSRYEIEDDELPWLLAEYSKISIPYRIKHDSDRIGVPYLVYQSANVINSFRGK